jgi:hypothetical protein
MLVELSAAWLAVLWVDCLAVSDWMMAVRLVSTATKWVDQWALMAEVWAA